MQSRRIARELALMGMSQLPDQIRLGAAQTDVGVPLKGAIAAVMAEVKETLEVASAELTRAGRNLLTSETRTDEPDAPRQEVQTVISGVRTAVERLAFAEELPKDQVPTLIIGAKDMLVKASAELKSCDQRLPYRPADQATNSPTRDAITLVQTAINRLGPAVELYQWVPVAQQAETLDYAGQILQQLTQHQAELDTTLDDAMEGWKLKRLARVDRDILRIALTEILYLQLDKRIAIDEAVEVAKRYSDDAGYRFINGVMRRVTDRLNAAPAENSSAEAPPVDANPSVDGSPTAKENAPKGTTPKGITPKDTAPEDTAMGTSSKP